MHGQRDEAENGACKRLQERVYKNCPRKADQWEYDVEPLHGLQHLVDLNLSSQLFPRVPEGSLRVLPSFDD